MCAHVCVLVCMCAMENVLKPESKLRVSSSLPSTRESKGLKLGYQAGRQAILPAEPFYCVPKPQF